MLSNLVGQYVIVGYGDDRRYHVIVAVFIERGELFLMARNPDSYLVQYRADCCVVVSQTPHQIARNEAFSVWNSMKEGNRKDELWRKYEAYVRKIEETTSE